jgi:predicted esterase
MRKAKTLFIASALLMQSTSWSAAQASERGSAVSFAAGTPAEGTAFERREASDGHGGAIPYYLAPVAGGPKPLLLVIQGSGCEALFVRGKRGLSATAGQDIVQKMAAGRYVVGVVEKPHVSPEGPARADGTTDACSAAFNRDHALDGWTSTLSAALDVALMDPAVDSRAGVRVMGLSEGAIVAAHLAHLRLDIGHAAFISGFGCNQLRDALVVARRSAKDASAADAAVAAAQEGLKAVAADPTATDKQVDGQTHLFWSTFGRACPARDLVESHARVFLAFGTADEEIDANGIEEIPATFIAAGRPITVHRVYGGSHVLDTPGTAGFANLIGVFGEVLDWMQR